MLHVTNITNEPTIRIDPTEIYVGLPDTSYSELLVMTQAIHQSVPVEFYIQKFDGVWTETNYGKGVKRKSWWAETNLRTDARLAYIRTDLELLKKFTRTFQESLIDMVYLWATDLSIVAGPYSAPIKLWLPMMLKDSTHPLQTRNLTL